MAQQFGVLRHHHGQLVARISALEALRQVPGIEFVNAGDAPPAFRRGERHEIGYADFKIGVILRQAREAAGLTQDEEAQKSQTKKSAISRIEDHAEDVRLSTTRILRRLIYQRKKI